jgi:tRNA(Ile)-lysidine synthase
LFVGLLPSSAARVPRTRFHPFEAAVLATARRRRLFGRDACILAAVSGGADSTALLSVLASLRQSGELATLVACHVDHQLRSDSALDGAFCEGLCRQLGVPLERTAVTVPAASGVQAAARRARYAALHAIAASVGADAIATGHTRSDQAETVLLRLLRGAGARGLGGIPARRGRIVRPLLWRSRAEVVGYLTDRGLAWREDPSNASARYLRNRVRAEVVPALVALAPAVEAHLARAAELLREDDRALERIAARIAPRGSAGVAIARVLAAPLAIRRRVVRRLWRSAAGTRRGLTAGHVASVLALLRRGRPGRVALPRQLEARAAYGRLEVGPAASPPLASVDVDVEAPLPGRYALPGRSEVLEIACGVGETPLFPLRVRTRRAGDRFRPESGRGGKKLKAWLIDRKVPRTRRDALLIVVDALGRIVAIPELGARGVGAGALEARLVRG